jgi:hypothetical protein
MVAPATPSVTPTFYQNDLAMSNTVDVIGAKPIAVWLQSILGGDAVNPLVAFYDVHGRKREVLLFCPGHHTRPKYQKNISNIQLPARITARYSQSIMCFLSK